MNKDLKTRALTAIKDMEHSLNELKAEIEGGFVFYSCAGHPMTCDHISSHYNVLVATLGAAKIKE